MDSVIEGVVLGIDLLVFSYCCHHYLKTKHSINLIQTADVIDLNRNLRHLVTGKEDGDTVPYVCLRGIVHSLDKPIISTNNNSIKGVVQVLRIKEHAHRRTSTGFWINSERIIQEYHNETPFCLQSADKRHNTIVEVVNPLSADVLDMDIISNVYTPTNNGFMNYIWGYFAGVRQFGVETVELMLREGTYITGIGQLVYYRDTDQFKLQPPSNGGQFLLTKMSKPSILTDLDGTQRTYRFVSVVTGVTAVAVTCHLLKKLWRWRCARREQERRKRQIEIDRRARRRQRQSQNDVTEQLCVVCQTHCVEIILLPCGHVCLCDECSEQIQDNCPICRTMIISKSVAYLV